MAAGQDARWLAVGSSTDADSRRAGQRAAAEALRGEDAKLLVVFCSQRHELPALLTGVGEASGGVPLIGCSTAGELATGGAEGHHVVVTAFGGPGFQAATATATGVSSGQRAAGAAIAGCVEQLGQTAHRVLLVLTDGHVGHQEEVVRGAYSVLGASVPLVGGCAGDDAQAGRTSQLYGTSVLTDAVVAAAIGSDAPFGIGVRHGWRKVGTPMIVTRSEDSRIITLDDEPALDVYLRLLDAPAEAHHDPAAFSGFAQTHPITLSRRGGEEMRCIAGADNAERSLVSVAAVPQGGLVWLTEGDADSVLDATDSACTDALAPLGDRPALGLLAFDCIGRRGILGDIGADREARRVAKHADGAPYAGFYTYGEIARVRGMNGFHQQTLVVLAVS